jgi:hypothetical protein
MKKERCDGQETEAHRSDPDFPMGVVALGLAELLALAGVERAAVQLLPAVLDQPFAERLAHIKPPR